MHWLADIPSGVWAGILTPILLAAAIRAGSELIKPDSDGWIRLRPSIVVVVLGLFCLAMAIGTTLFIVLAIANIFTAKSVGLFLLVSTPLAAFLWYVVYAFLLIGGRFNAEGFVYRGALRTHFVSWRDVSRIAYDGFWGTYAVTGHGGLLVSMYFKGFSEFLEEAKRHRIEVDEGIDRARSEGY